MQNCFCFKILLSAPKTAKKRKQKLLIYLWFKLKVRSFVFFWRYRVKNCTKILKSVCIYGKNYFEAFFLVSKFCQKFRLKMKSCHGPQETPKQNFEKNSLVYCQTSLLLSDAVWVETVSLKLVEEIAFAWASQTGVRGNWPDIIARPCFVTKNSYEESLGWWRYFKRARL